MKIETITLCNWLAFRGEQTIDNLPSAPIALIGRYAENRRRSNWAGKTALLEAIVYALFGVHRKRLEDGVIHRGTDECFVRITLGDGIVIRRGRVRGKPTVLTVKIGPDVTTGEAAEKRIADVLGMSHTDFLATQYFKQGDTESIIGREAGERRRVVTRWLELDVWERLTVRARAASNRLAGELRALVPIEATTTLEEVPALETRRDELLAKAAELEKEQTQWQREETRWREASKDEGAESQLRAAAEEMKRYRDAGAGDAQDVSAIEADVATKRAARDVAAKEVEDAKKLLSSGFDSVCPVVRQPCPSATWVSQQGAAAKQRHARSLPIFTEAQTAFDASRDALGQAQRGRDEEIRRTARMEALKKQMHDLRARVDARKARLAELTLGEEEIRDALSRVRAALLKTREELGLVTGKITHARTEVARAKAQAEARVRVEREARIANLVAKAVSPSGIPARIASVQLRGLEEQANVLLGGTGLSFELAWERETKELTMACEECGYAFKGKKDKACPACSAPRGMKRSDELEILVEDGSGEVEDVRAKSGGAKVLVASAIRLAGGAMLRDLRGSPVRFALVDEPFGPLDAENREGLARSFAGMLGSVGLEQAFVVSHDAVLLDALPARIIVTRERGFSTLSME